MRASSRGLYAQGESYFSEYLPRQRGASAHTVRAYRDALTLMLKFLAERRRCGMAALQLTDLDAEAVMGFLDHIETERANSPATRNCRRAAIRSFFNHLLRNDLTHSQQYIRVLAIPAKKAPQRPATYLEPEDARLIIEMPDKRTPDGWRDYTLLLFLYNCGARVGEAIGLRWEDLQLTAPRQARLHGKGKKERLLPIWPKTDNALHKLRCMTSNAQAQSVFINRLGQPLTRDGIAYVLRKHTVAAAATKPTLKHKRITPHVLRRGVAASWHRRDGYPRLPRPLQRGHNGPLRHHQLVDEARGDASVLEENWRRTSEHEAVEAKSRSARLPPVPLITATLCGVRWLCLHPCGRLKPVKLKIKRCS